MIMLHFFSEWDGSLATDRSGHSDALGGRDIIATRRRMPDSLRGVAGELSESRYNDF